MVSSGYCPPCSGRRQQQYESSRGTATERLYNAKWHRASRAFLREKPYCVVCLAQNPPRYTRATEVDHVKPHEGDLALFWDESNWQGLCKPHHSSKTLRESWAKGVVNG